MDSYRDLTCHAAWHQYNRVEKLGEGAFGEVWLVQDKSSGGNYALKVVFVNMPGLTTVQQAILCYEANFLMQLAHPHIVQGHQIVTGSSDQPWCIVMEALRGRCILADLSMVEYSETAVARLFAQIVDAVRYLHSNRIIHRDIKPENVMFCEPVSHWLHNVETARLKLLDFSLATVHNPDSACHGVVGSRGFVAPEVILQEPHTPAMDIFSLGVLLHIVLVGRLPMSIADAMNLAYSKTESWAYESTHTPAWKALSLTAKDLLLLMLDRDPARRPTAAQVLQHAWMLPHAWATSPERRIAPRVREGMHAVLQAREKLRRNVQQVHQRDHATPALAGSQSAVAAARRSRKVAHIINTTPASGPMGHVLRALPFTLGLLSIGQRPALQVALQEAATVRGARLYTATAPQATVKRAIASHPIDTATFEAMPAPMTTQHGPVATAWQQPQVPSYATMRSAAAIPHRHSLDSLLPSNTTLGNISSTLAAPGPWAPTAAAGWGAEATSGHSMRHSFAASRAASLDGAYTHSHASGSLMPRPALQRRGGSLDALAGMHDAGFVDPMSNGMLAGGATWPAYGMGRSSMPGFTQAPMGAGMLPMQGTQMAGAGMGHAGMQQMQPQGWYGQDAYGGWYPRQRSGWHWPWSRAQYGPDGTRFGSPRRSWFGRRSHFGYDPWSPTRGWFGNRSWWGRMPADPSGYGYPRRGWFGRRTGYGHDGHMRRSWFGNSRARSFGGMLPGAPMSMTYAPSSASGFDAPWGMQPPHDTRSSFDAWRAMPWGAPAGMGPMQGTMHGMHGPMHGMHASPSGQLYPSGNGMAPQGFTYSPHMHQGGLPAQGTIPAQYGSHGAHSVNTPQVQFASDTHVMPNAPPRRRSFFGFSRPAAGRAASNSGALTPALSGTSRQENAAAAEPGSVAAAEPAANMTQGIQTQPPASAGLQRSTTVANKQLAAHAVHDDTWVPRPATRAHSVSARTDSFAHNLPFGL